jgi:hypothetical protein
VDRDGEIAVVAGIAVHGSNPLDFADTVACPTLVYRTIICRIGMRQMD